METVMWCTAAVAIAGTLVLAIGRLFPEEVDALAELLGLDGDPEWRS